MLQRDKYQPDGCFKFLPNTSFQEYCTYAYGNNFRSLVNQNKQFIEQLNMKNNLVVGTLLVSLIPVFAHKKIYYFRNYHSIKVRVLMGLCWIFVPSNIVGGIFHQQSQNQLAAKYQLHKNEFSRMIYQGDINIMNPSQQWSEY